MHALARDGFRFEPPALSRSLALDWVLVRAFAPARSSAPVLEDVAGALALAARLGLASRIAARWSADSPATDGTGATLVEELRRIRAEAVALDLRLEAALVAATAVAAERGIECVALKGSALRLAGLSPVGGRPAADVDLLVKASRLAELQNALSTREFRPSGSPAYEHQAPLLLHAAGGALELHLSIPGVRVDGRRGATFEDLEQAGMLEAPDLDRSARARAVRIPARQVMIAHALAHTLAQHGLAASHPGFQMVADLIDLGCTAGRAALGPVEDWISRDVTQAEGAAALELVAALAAGNLGILDTGYPRSRRLAAHFVACATDPAYGEALKLRMFERPVSDRPVLVARISLLARTLAPSAGQGLRSLLRRPFELAARWRAARKALRADRQGNSESAESAERKPAGPEGKSRA